MHSLHTRPTLSSNESTIKVTLQNAVISFVIAVMLFYIYLLHNKPENIGKLIPLPLALATYNFNMSKLLWGTYRPHVYFGMRAKHAHSPVFGLMWATQLEENFFLRHTCSDFRCSKPFTWEVHDGQSFGIQTIEDKTYTLKTTFIKCENNSTDDEDWTMRISVNEKVVKTLCNMYIVCTLETTFQIYILMLGVF